MTFVVLQNEQKLDYVLALTVEKFLDRRLQTRVFQQGLAKSIHHARVLIKQRHIRFVFLCLLILSSSPFKLQSLCLRSVGKRMVDIPSFMVRLDSEKHIEFALTSPFGAGRPGRVKRKTAKTGGKKKEGDKAKDAGV